MAAEKGRAEPAAAPVAAFPIIAWMGAPPLNETAMATGALAAETEPVRTLPATRAKSAPGDQGEELLPSPITKSPNAGGVPATEKSFLMTVLAAAACPVEASPPAAASMARLCFPAAREGSAKAKEPAGNTPTSLPSMEALIEAGPSSSEADPRTRPPTSATRESRRGLGESPAAS